MLLFSPYSRHAPLFPTLLLPRGCSVARVLSDSREEVGELRKIDKFRQIFLRVDELTKRKRNKIAQNIRERGIETPRHRNY